jgi:hypothetical protein
VRGLKRTALQELFAANRRLFKIYVLREQLDRLWTYTTRKGGARFLFDWLRALRWQRLPETEKLARRWCMTTTASRRTATIASASGLESFDPTIKAVLRRAWHAR